MLGQMTWGDFAGLAGVIVGGVSVTTALMSRWLAAVRGQLTDRVANVAEDLKVQSGHLDRVHTRLQDIEEHRVTRKEFAINVARNSGKLDQLHADVSEVRGLIVELRGQVAGEHNMAARVEQSVLALAKAITQERIE